MMHVRVKVFATLSRYLPGTKPGTPLLVDTSEGATLGALVEQLALPADEVKAVYVNGRRQPMDYILKPGDELGIFPPIGGG